MTKFKRGLETCLGVRIRLKADAALNETTLRVSLPSMSNLLLPAVHSRWSPLRMLRGEYPWPVSRPEER